MNEKISRPSPRFCRGFSLGAAILTVSILHGCRTDHAKSTPAPHFEYPAAKRVDVADDYHGAKVADPYRWLEAPDAPDTKAYVDAENKLVRDYLDSPQRESIKARLTELWNYPRISPPAHRGRYYFFSKNDGLQNQSVVYLRESPNSEPKLLMDPNTFSKDGTIALNSTSYTRDGKLLAYKLSSGGSDQATIHVRAVEADKDLPDVLEYCKFANVAWKADQSGFWYNRYPTPGSVPAEDQARFNKLYWHKLGDPQSADRIVFAPDDKELGTATVATEDNTFLVMQLSRGSTPKNRMYYRPMESDGDFIRLFDAEDASYSFVSNDGPIFFVETDKGAPKHRLIAVDIRARRDEGFAGANAREVIPESSDVMQSVSVINNQFVVTYLHDAHHVVKLFNKDGKPDREIELPGIGSVGGITGERDDGEMFFSYTAFAQPTTNYRYDFASAKLSVYNKPEVKCDPSLYESKQVFIPSKDGTKVPMFITHKKGLKLNGANPTILSGYGGFNVSQTPSFSASRVAWLEQGGVVAVACLRGGGEYGESWHLAGMREKKQNVFDDFQSCAQSLIDQKYTTSKKLAIEGGSNGGLLVATCLTQRPDLYGAVLCHVPLTDMLRFHHFTVARFWIPEYGSADASAEQFNWLRAYSPLHNVRPGTKYPPTLVYTADGDDRVAPLHARKFVATLQAEGAGGPILLRTDTRAGHGGGKPTAKQIDEVSDTYTFLAKAFGMTFEK